MRNVAHADAVAMPAPLPPPSSVVVFEANPGTARHTALVRWHQASLRMDTAIAHPRYPVIAGGAGGDGEA